MLQMQDKQTITLSDAESTSHNREEQTDKHTYSSVYNMLSHLFLTFMMFTQCTFKKTVCHNCQSFLWNK